MPAAGGETAVAAEGTGEFSFGEITYPLSLFSGVAADANGVKTLTYEYTVAEVLPDGVTDENPIKDGIRYDTTEKTVTVTVTYKEATGEMATAVSPDETKVLFTNEQLGSVRVTCSPKAPAWLCLPGSKSLLKSETRQSNSQQAEHRPIT